MLHQTIKLGVSGDVTLTTYIHHSPAADCQVLRPAIIIMPGGGYVSLTDSEAEPVALTFLQKGFNTFVLRYSVGDACVFPRILEEVSLAILKVRKHSEEWHINPNAIVLMGFSAGACLAAMSATQWNTAGLAERLGVCAEQIRPDAAVIGYAPWDNTNTIQRDPEFYNPHCGKIAKDCTPELDFINYAGPHMPPLFLWHNRYDKLVSAINPLMIASRMMELRLPFELHIFQGGEHGMSVSNELCGADVSSQAFYTQDPNVPLWVPMCANWIHDLFPNLFKESQV